MLVKALRRATKQLETESAVFRDVDPEVYKGLKELATEPLAMCEQGDYLGAIQHIEWLKLDPDDLALFWALFDSTQRRLMKEASRK